MTTLGDRAQALQVALDAAREAAELVMRVYATAFAVDYKGVNDPVTQADREANALIVARLTTAFPGVPVVAEESDPASFAGFGAAAAAWFVDPLDGTREFVAKNGEFAVMIGLAEAGRATAGVVLCPALGRTFAGGEGLGAYEIDAAGARRPVRASGTAAIEAARVVVSRSRRSAALDELLTRLGVAEITSTGSSGIKAALVAVGERDVYVQLGRAGKRWDSCAPEAIVRAAGGVMTDAHGAPFDYVSGELTNARGVLACAAGLQRVLLNALSSG